VRVEWSAAALADLEQIAAYIEQDRNRETANRVLRAIYDAVQSLRRMPYRGRYGRIENTRELIIPRLPYIAVYQVLNNFVVILDIVHGAQKWP
jgi:toxin ParE1/3/4